jgi:hypothetical protein
MLAFSTIRKTQLKFTISNENLSFLGFLLLIFGFILITKDSSFPGWWALFPTIGGVLIIAAGKDAWLNKKILGSKILVYVGLISYPLYLWHWPVLVLGKISGVTDLYGGQVMLLFLSTFLAILTYHLVETPIRRAPTYLTMRVVIYLFAMMMLIAALGTLIMLSIKPYHATDQIQKIISAVGEWDYPGRLQVFNHQGYKYRHQGDSTSNEILFFGDSNIEQYYPRAEYNLRKGSTSSSLIFFTSGGCPPIPLVFEDAHRNCFGFVENALSYANRPEVRVVVIGAQWFGYLNESSKYYFKGENINYPLRIGDKGYILALKSLQEMVVTLVGQGKKVYLIGNIPVGVELDPKSMISRSLSTANFIAIKPTVLSMDQLMLKYGRINKDLRGIADSSGAIFISPIDYLCDQSSCKSLTSEGDPIYKDSSHLRPTFVRDYALFIDDIFVNNRQLK